MNGKKKLDEIESSRTNGEDAGEEEEEEKDEEDAQGKVNRKRDDFKDDVERLIDPLFVFFILLMQSHSHKCKAWQLSNLSQLT